MKGNIATFVKINPEVDTIPYEQIKNGFDLVENHILFLMLNYDGKSPLPKDLKPLELKPEYKMGIAINITFAPLTEKLIEMNPETRVMEFKYEDDK